MYRKLIAAVAAGLLLVVAAASVLAGLSGMSVRRHSPPCVSGELTLRRQHRGTSVDRRTRASGSGL